MGQEINEFYISKRMEVLIEEKQGEYYKGHTRNYLYVKVKSKGDIQNKIVEVKIKDAQAEMLIGVNV